MVMWSKESRYTMLVKAYSVDLFRFALWLCRNRETAEDLVQETFARAWRSLDDLRDEKAAKAWLFTTLRREHARLYERKRLEMADVPTENLAAPASDSYDTRTEAHVLRQALAELSEDYREPLLLQVLGGYTCAEIGEQLGISPNAVMTRLFRARKKLLAMLGEDELTKVEEAQS